MINRDTEFAQYKTQISETFIVEIMTLLHLRGGGEIILISFRLKPIISGIQAKPALCDLPLFHR
jgi:hypothetical protein